LRFYGFRDLDGRRREATLLVPPGDRTLYEELTGLPADGAFHSRKSRKQAGAVHCFSPQPVSVDIDENAHLGPWKHCAECNRRYRPINVWGCCYGCRRTYGLPLDAAGQRR
jgi:hypothetical protein